MAQQLPEGHDCLNGQKPGSDVAPRKPSNDTFSGPHCLRSIRERNIGSAEKEQPITMAFPTQPHHSDRLDLFPFKMSRFEPDNTNLEQHLRQKGPSICQIRVSPKFPHGTRPLTKVTLENGDGRMITQAWCVRSKVPLSFLSQDVAVRGCLKCHVLPPGQYGKSVDFSNGGKRKKVQLQAFTTCIMRCNGYFKSVNFYVIPSPDLSFQYSMGTNLQKELRNVTSRYPPDRPTHAAPAQLQQSTASFGFPNNVAYDAPNVNNPPQVYQNPTQPVSQYHSQPQQYAQHPNYPQGSQPKQPIQQVNHFQPTMGLGMQGPHSGGHSPGAAAQFMSDGLLFPNSGPSMAQGAPVGNGAMGNGINFAATPGLEANQALSVLSSQGWQMGSQHSEGGFSADNPAEFPQFPDTNLDPSFWGPPYEGNQ